MGTDVLILPNNILSRPELKVVEWMRSVMAKSVPSTLGVCPSIRRGRVPGFARVDARRRDAGVAVTSSRNEAAKIRNGCTFFLVP